MGRRGGEEPTVRILHSISITVGKTLVTALPATGIIEKNLAFHLLPLLLEQTAMSTWNRHSLT